MRVPQLHEQWRRPPPPLRAANLVISTVDGIKPLPQISSQEKNCNQPHETDLDVMSEKHSGRNGNLWELQVVRDACLLWWSSSNHGKAYAKISFVLKNCKHILVPWCLDTLTGLVVSCNLDNEKDLIRKHMFQWKRKSWTSVSKVKNPNALCVASLHNAHWKILDENQLMVVLHGT